MSTILVEIFNLGFETVTIVKASTGSTIATIGEGDPSKTFSLLNTSNSVQISAASPQSATVSLEGSEDNTSVSVQGVGVESALYADDPVTISLSTATILTLQSAAARVDGLEGVKCGEVIILPEPS